MSQPREHERHVTGKPGSIDAELLRMGLRLTPDERLQWLDETVTELLPWLGLATRKGRPIGDQKVRPTDT